MERDLSLAFALDEALFEFNCFEKIAIVTDRELL
jgi:hypothetical protein